MPTLTKAPVALLRLPVAPGTIAGLGVPEEFGSNSRTDRNVQLTGRTAVGEWIAESADLAGRSLDPGHSGPASCFSACLSVFSQQNGSLYGIVDRN